MSMEELRNMHLSAKDGEIGRVRDFLFEEDSWTIRWLVADTGSWLMGRKVLVSPMWFTSPDPFQETFPVNLTRRDIETAPSLDEDAPVSREMERSYFHHVHWPYYWMGGGLWAGMNSPYLSNPLDASEGFPQEDEEEITEPHLRSGHELTHYRLQNGDETLGYAEDVLLDTEDWSMKYLQFDTRKWFHGKTLQLSPNKITRVNWVDHAVVVDVTQQELEEAIQRAFEVGVPPAITG